MGKLEPGFRLDVFITETRKYAEYTSLKQPMPYAMIWALGKGLERQGAGGRIVDCSTGEIIREWPETKGRVRDLRAVTQQIREQHGH